MYGDNEIRLRLEGYTLVTVNVLYYMPDHRNLVNEFLWQTMDVSPRYPRIERFLDHWRREIDAVIKEVQISNGAAFDPSRYTNVTGMFGIQ